MDVSHLERTPNPSGPNASGATGAAAARTRTERAPFETAAIETSESASSARPAFTPGHLSADRVERSPELARTLAELGLALARTPDASQERIDSLRLEVADGRLAAGGSFETAAHALLHREPFAAP
jgi:hypothetical protein